MMRKNWKLDKLPNEASRPQLYDLYRTVIRGVGNRGGGRLSYPKKAWTLKYALFLDK